MVNQPISLAIHSKDVAVARELFEKTALVVYTVGTDEKPENKTVVFEWTK